MTTELAVHLPRPHAKQQAIRAHAAKRHVICAGRRAGKTTLASMVAVESALAKRRVLYATPTQEQAEAFWEKCKDALAAPIMAGVVYKNESTHLLRISGRGQVRAKTAWDADTLRGDYADLLILDEYAQMKANAWDKVGAPMLLDNDGDAWFIGTPMRKNHFYAMYVRAMQDGKRWRHWHFTSHDNPHLSKEALDEISADLTEEGYKQEILAEFLENEGAVFRNLAACMGAPETTPEQHAGHRVVMGVDWGKKQDFTTISVLCADCRQELAHDRFNKIDYHFQRGRLVSLATEWGAQLIEPEANAMGEAIIDELAADAKLDGIMLRPFATTVSSKPPLIQSLALAMEKAECQWLNDPLWTAELEAYEVKFSANTGRPSYGAPEGVHDDTVIARALAWHAASIPIMVERAPSPYAPLSGPIAPPTKREIAASAHSNSPLHKKWAQKHFCQQCYDEYLREGNEAS